MSNIVQSVGRALSILELLADYDEGLGITEIGEKASLHKSTVHRLLGTLIYKGFVEQSEITNKYRISLKLYELGSKRIAGMDLVSASKLYTKELMENTNEVVHLVVRDGNDIVYTDKVDANNTIRVMTSAIGKRSELYSTSVGKAILAFLDEAEVERIWAESDIKKWTSNTITDLGELKSELELIRHNGYAEDNEENELGVRCVGAPVFNHDGVVEGAISVSGPTIRVTRDKVEELGGLVKKYADLISRELGYNKV